MWLDRFQEYFNFEELSSRLVPLPWRLICIGLGVAFVLANVASAFLGGLFLSPSEGVRASRNSYGANSFVDPLPLGAMITASTEDIEKISKRNLFNSEGAVGEDEVESDKEDQIPKTDLPIRVVGIIYGGNPWVGMATVENTAKNSVNSFLVGDMVSKEAKLIEVHRRRIIIEREGQKEYAELLDALIKRSSRIASKGGDSQKSAATAGLGGYGKAAPTKFSEPGFDRDGAKIRLTNDYKDQLLNQNLAQVLQDAKAEPYQVDGALKGFRMTKIRENSIYYKSGLQNDDIVEEINGVPLNDIPGSIRLLNQLRNEKEIEVRVKRGDASFTINLNVL